MKIQLINAPLSSKYSTTIRAAAFPPLNLIALATHIKKHYSTCEIEIVDGELTDTSLIIQRLDGDIVGISSNTLTYDNALSIAKAAKNVKAKVIIGGPHASVVGESILRNRPFIDVAVYGDGENALLSLIRGYDYEQIPNIIFRRGNHFIRTERNNVPFENIPFPDYSLHDITPYSQRFRSIYPRKPFHKPFAIFSAKGCYWRMISKGCIFCAVTHSELRMKNPKKVWDEIIWHQDKWGADFMWDTSDTFTMQKEWIKEFVRLKPTDCKVHFHIYGRSNDIDEEKAKLLCKLGVYEILIGFESGNDRILENTGKGIKVASSRKAVQILHDYGIKVIPSIILGLPGETKESIDDSCNFVKELIDQYDIQEGYCSMVLPLPGSRMMKRLIDLPESAIDRESDKFDLERLRHIWIENFTDVSYDLVLSRQSEILSLFPLAGSLAKPLEKFSDKINIGKESHKNERIYEIENAFAI